MGPISDPYIKFTILPFPSLPSMIASTDPAPHGAMSFDTVWLYVGAAALAVCFHLSIIPHEIDFQVKRLFVLYVASIGGLYYLLVRQNIPNIETTTVRTVTTFNAALFTSILIHRVFLHRAGRFPGPFMARVSKFYSVFLSAKLQYHKEVEQLHKKYGDFVRTGECNFVYTKIPIPLAVY
jgi:hypothetical protein